MAMLVCLAVAMFSCNKDDEEIAYTEADLIGAWTVSSIESVAIAGDTKTETFSTLAYDEDAIFTIEEDKTYSITDEEGDTIYREGEWKLENGKTISLENDQDYEITALGEGSLTLYYKNSQEILGVEAGHSETVMLKSK